MGLDYLSLDKDGWVGAGGESFGAKRIWVILGKYVLPWCDENFFIYSQDRSDRSALGILEIYKKVNF